MGFIQRVREDDNVIFYKQYLLWQMLNGKWRVYEDGSYYSQVSGGVSKRGKVMRNVDDKPLSFVSQKDAEDWIDGGCRVTLDF